VSDLIFVLNSIIRAFTYEEAEYELKKELLDKHVFVHKENFIVTDVVLKKNILILKREEEPYEYEMRKVKKIEFVNNKEEIWVFTNRKNYIIKY